VTSVVLNYFLQIDGIKGDSRDGAHMQWIQVDRFSKTSQTVMSFNQAVSDSSATGLMQFCCNGKNIPSATFELLKDGKLRVRYDLTNLAVTGVNFGGSTGDAPPAVEFSLTCASIKMTYFPGPGDDDWKP
jgi:type VI secretion system secreted protein Hcp